MPMPTSRVERVGPQLCRFPVFTSRLTRLARGTRFGCSQAQRCQRDWRVTAGAVGHQLFEISNLQPSFFPSIGDGRGRREAFLKVPSCRLRMALSRSRFGPRTPATSLGPRSQSTRTMPPTHITQMSIIGSSPWKSRAGKDVLRAISQTDIAGISRGVWIVGGKINLRERADNLILALADLSDEFPV